MGLGKNGLILHNERMPILSIGRFTNISPLSYPVKCTVYYEKGRYDMYYDPYMYDGPIYDPWTPVEYDYRYPVGYPGPGIGGGAVPGIGGGAGPGFGGGAGPGFGGGAVPGFGGGAGPGVGGGAPQGPPPHKKPAKPTKPQGLHGAAYLVEPVLIQPCLFRFTYVWLTNGSSFWFYPVILGRESVGGFYWDASHHRWFYYALDTKHIDVVSCSF